jgi:translocation and assembly module TamA
MIFVMSCAARQKQDAPVVRDLEIKGNRAISDRQIEKKILTSDTGWWPFARKKYFDPMAWQADLKRIERLYVSRGFYQAEVLKDRVDPQPENRVALEVEISEGQPTKIGSLDIHGLDGVGAAERAAALDELPLKVGDVFEEGDWEAAKSAIASRLRARGYAKVEVEGQAMVDVKTHQAALTLLVRPGRRYFFGGIDIRTQPGAQIQPLWIWEQARLAIPEGEPYSDDALEEAQRRIFGMGVFSTVRVQAGSADDATSRIPIVVDAREAPFRTLRAGVGLRIDQIRNEARLIGDWTHRNFKGGMRKLNLHAEAGWAFIPNTYAVVTNQITSGPRNGPIARTRIEFEQPRLFGRPSLRERSRLELDRTLEQAYNALSARLVNGVNWQPRSSLSIFPSHNLEASYLNGPPISSAATAPLTLGCDTTSASCFVWLSYVEELVTWDRRDKALDPRRGWYTSLSLQQGGGPLGGRFDYFRALPDVRAYVSFGDDDELTLSGRLRVGELWTVSGNPDDSAVVTRFYGGGGMSMRGFNDRRLSPLLLAPAPGADPGVVLSLPIGGNGMIDGSFEARYSLTESLRVAAFADMGQVTRGRLSPADAARALWAVGIGIRYVTPIGPIRVDLARRLPIGRLPPLYTLDMMTGAIVDVPYAADDSCFGLFGSGVMTPVRESMCALHISIGEAF